MSDASGLGFGSVLWGQTRLESESGELCHLYQGRFSKLQEGENLIRRIEKSVASGELQYVELLIFTDKMVFESIYYKGASMSFTTKSSNMREK